MYLSRVLLSGDHLHNPYEIHRTLWKAFPGESNLARDFLFRIEKRKSCQVQVLMQSQRIPKEQEDNIHVLATKAYKLSLPKGSNLRFLLIANPVKTITDAQGRLNSKGEIKKCRVPLIKEEEQTEWFKRKLAGAVLVTGLEAEKLHSMYFRKQNRRGKIQPLSFKGSLQVQDPLLLDNLIQEGVGPAKAFGCGLLSLAVL